MQHLNSPSMNLMAIQSLLSEPNTQYSRPLRVATIIMLYQLAMTDDTSQIGVLYTSLYYVKLEQFRIRIRRRSQSVVNLEWGSSFKERYDRQRQYLKANMPITFVSESNQNLTSLVSAPNGPVNPLHFYERLRQRINIRLASI
jgi:hypothetical protein